MVLTPFALLMRCTQVQNADLSEVYKDVLQHQLKVRMLIRYRLL